MTLDNDQGHATGWLPGQLSERGLEQARQLGQRRARDGIAAVFSSDLARATQTATEAFAGREISVLYDWRLRECDYGQRNGMPVAELHASRREHLDRPYPGGESWRQAVARVGRFLNDLPLRRSTAARAPEKHCGHWRHATTAQMTSDLGISRSGPTMK